ncbi:MAG TPA: hypothetical protein VJB59_08195 [Bdellovibrionota bacterium]|nr:hypothetical protein [Bdellovibrionota bacterium]
MTQRKKADHGPENAEHEIRKAFNTTIEAAVTYFWDRRPVPGVNPEKVIDLYKRSFQAYRKDDRLSAERWARTAKHLARAFWHEAKIAYLEPRANDLPYLRGASAEEYHLSERSDTTADLLNSVADHVPPGLSAMPENMQKYLARGREHIAALGAEASNQHELVRAEHIKAAHEYGRVLECLSLAYEAEAAKTAA